MFLNFSRRTRLVWLSPKLWRRRAVFVAGGLLVGLAAVLFTEVATFVQAEFQRLVDARPYASLVVTPAGLALCTYLAQRYVPNSQGSGIPQAIAARHLSDTKARGRLLSGRIAIGKIVLTLLGLLVGASAGREGPTVQVGSSIMHAMGSTTLGRQRGLILAGGAAGVAAAFNAPLAGIVFAIEELGRVFEPRTSSLVISTVIAAGLTSLALLGNYTYFGHTAASLPTLADWVAVPVAGISGGLLGGIFSRIVVLVAKGLPGRTGRWIKRYPMGFAAACCVVIAGIGILSHNPTYGTGYNEVRHLLDGTHPLPAGFGVLKMIATTLTAISGIPGGLFSPSLAVGAGFGANLAAALPQVPFGAVVLLGMVSYFTGVVQAPITAFVIVMEMTDNHTMLVPLMAASVLAYGASRLVCPKSVYHALAERFLHEARLAEQRGKEPA